MLQRRFFLKILAMPALALVHPRADTAHAQPAPPIALIYSDSLGNSQATLAVLKDGNRTGTGVTYPA